ncbi:hypothetical protein [Pseudonocardia asaccharolytica]|uniref:hypothetical protein n=1 Tax=Pseudonocardia asaccharolytica TaxID=54010 RepID=UPI0003F520A6|nr:hypothetical protein [Pseudonocardia asaccharolytica]
MTRPSRGHALARPGLNPRSEQVEGAGPQRGERVFVVVERRQHDDLDIGLFDAQPTGGA